MIKCFKYHQQVKYLLVLFFVFNQYSLFSQYEYQIKVIDSSTGIGISKAMVFSESSINYYTNSKGFIKIQCDKPSEKFYISKNNYFGRIVLLKQSNKVQNISLYSRDLEEIEIISQKINYIELIEKYLVKNSDIFIKDKDTLFYKFSKIQILNKDTIKVLTGNMFVIHNGYQKKKINNRAFISDYNLMMDSSACFSDAMDSVVYISLIWPINHDLVLKPNIKDFCTNRRQSEFKTNIARDSNYFNITFNTSSLFNEDKGLSFLEWSFLFSDKDSSINSFFGSTKAIYKKNILDLDSILFIFNYTYTDSIPKYIDKVKYHFNSYSDKGLVEQSIKLERIPRFKINESYFRVREYGPLNYQEIQ